MVADPENLAGVSSSRPQSRTANIVGIYDVTPTGGKKANPNGPWLWCSECQEKNHWNGYIVEGSDGNLHLIGQVCGRLHYGADAFADAKRRFQSKEQNAKTIARFKSFKKRTSDIVGEIDAFIISEPYLQLVRKRRELATASPDLVSRLTSLVDNVLYAHEKVKGQNGHIGFEKKAVGTLGGRALISGDFDHSISLVREALASLKECDIDYMTMAEVRAKNKLIGDCLSKLLSTHNQLATCYQFFSAANLKRLSRWSKPLAKFCLVEIGEDGSLNLSSEKNGLAVIAPLDRHLFAKLKTIESVLRGVV